MPTPFTKHLISLSTSRSFCTDKTAPDDETDRLGGYWFMLLSSGDLTFLLQPVRGSGQLDAVVQMWTLFRLYGCAHRHDKAHDYVLTGKRAGLTRPLSCTDYSPETGALRLVDTDDGEVIEFYEYVPLGNDTYPFSDTYSRPSSNSGTVKFFPLCTHKSRRAKPGLFARVTVTASTKTAPASARPGSLQRGRQLRTVYHLRRVKHFISKPTASSATVWILS
jgi:hypothetical protein